MPAPERGFETTNKQEEKSEHISVKHIKQYSESIQKTGNYVSIPLFCANINIFRHLCGLYLYSSNS